VLFEANDALHVFCIFEYCLEITHINTHKVNGTDPFEYFQDI